MARKAFGLILTVALALAWVAPLCAESSASSHACCVGGETPMPSPSKGQTPACCRAQEAVPSTVALSVQPPSPALLTSAASAVEPAPIGRVAPAPFVPAPPQAPPGTHSGLSPPSSGL